MNILVVTLSVIYIVLLIYQSAWSVSRIEAYYVALKKSYRRKVFDFSIFLFGGLLFYLFLLFDFGVINVFGDYFVFFKRNLLAFTGFFMMLFSYHISLMYEGDRIIRLGIRHADSSSVASQRNSFYFFSLFGLLFVFMNFRIF
ncbi:MAG: hypothetical protein KAG82_08080 [Alcanivoracaceae bacterium]|nr:hypothetical protein [Alcanivoracaceae bacterium]